MLWPTGVVRSEIELIIDDANNKRIVSALSARSALGSKDAGGVGPLGALDKASVCVSALNEAYTSAVNVLSDTKTVLDSTQRYVESGRVALELRKALKSEDWEGAEAVLQSAGFMDGGKLMAPSYDYVSTVMAELDLAAERVLNRRAYQMLEASAKLGAARGVVGRLDCSRVSTAAMSNSIDFAASLTRRSERTDSALSLCRALVALRESQSDMAIDYDRMRDALKQPPIAEAASFVAIDTSIRSSVKEEVYLARSELRNHDGLIALASRLVVGGAEGAVGALELGTISFKDLRAAADKVIEWSGSPILSQSAELVSLCALARSIVSVRMALQEDDWSGLASALKIAEDKRIFSSQAGGEANLKQASDAESAMSSPPDVAKGRSRRESITRGGVGGKVQSAGENMLLREISHGSNVFVDPAMADARLAFDAGIVELGIAFAELENHNVIEWLSEALASGNPTHVVREPLDCSTISTENLHASIEKAKGVRSKLTARSAAIVHCASVIARMRERLVSSSWESGEQLARDEIASGFDAVVNTAYPSNHGYPSMSGVPFPSWELDVSYKHLKDIRLRSTMLSAISSGWPIHGVPGDCDLTVITTDALASSCALSEELGVTTTLAENIVRTSRLLIELRGAWAEKELCYHGVRFRRANAELETGKLEPAVSPSSQKQRKTWKSGCFALR